MGIRPPASRRGILSAPTSGVGARNPFRYRGYYYDAETGFYYLQSRYYDPEVSRFINADVVMNTGSLIGTNLFAYCFNNPANHMDDNGYWPKYYTPVNSPYINCYAYALGFSYKGLVPRTSPSSPIQVVYDQVYRHLVYGLGIDAIKLGTNYSSKRWDSRTYFLIAMRSGRGGNADLGYSGDYHFMVRHENLTWSHKPGSNPSMYLGKVNPSMIPWHRYSWLYPYQKTIHNYYNSATYYIAVRKWTAHIHQILWAGWAALSAIQ